MANKLKGLGYLRKKLAAKEQKVKLRYRYYELKNEGVDFGISTPPNLRAWSSAVGWCAKGVDNMADRLVFKAFRDDAFDLNGIYRANNPDTFFASAVQSALIASCCFVYISVGGAGEPKMQVIDAANATGVMDTITGMLSEGYAVLSRDDQGHPIDEAYFTPKETVYFFKGRQTMETNHGAGFPLLVPVVYRPDAVRPFGHSRISRACMSYVGSAMRTIKRSEIAAEFYSYPQKYIMGTGQELDLESWKAAMDSMLVISKDEDGDKPTAGQFQQQAMTPHLEQLRMFASLFAGETGLTLEDMGFPMDVPSSADSIKAAHESMRLACRAAQRNFGAAFRNAGFLAACIRDKQSYTRELFLSTIPVWEPIFEPDASSIGIIGDAIVKINNAAPGFFGATNIADMIGIEAENDG